MMRGRSGYQDWNEQPNIIILYKYHKYMIVIFGPMPDGEPDIFYMR